MAGRKSLKEEIQLVRRMTELSEPIFRFISEMANSSDPDLKVRKSDRQWATDQMMKLYTKALPTEVTGEDGGAIVTVVKYDNGNNITTPLSTEGLPEATVASI